MWSCFSGAVAQASRHAEVYKKAAAGEPEQQVFGPALHRDELLAGKDGVQVRRDRQAQAAVADDGAGGGKPGQFWGDAPAGRFYFGEFWHGETAEAGRRKVPGRGLLAGLPESA